MAGTSSSKTILFLYNQFQDAVIQSNIWLYIQDIIDQKDNDHTFALITYETSATLRDRAHMEQLKQSLRTKKVYWYPLPWRQGTALHLKFADLVSSFYRILTLRAMGFNTIISLGSVAGAYAYVIALLFRLRLYLYQYEPHSEYEIDSGTYTRESMKFKALNFLERKSAMYASVISSGTVHMLSRLRAWKVKAAVFRIPSVVNETKFSYNAEDAADVRKQLGIPEGKWVLLYPGKFGGLYFRHETAVMFSTLLKCDERFFALIITPNDTAYVQQLMLDAGVPVNRLAITQSGYDTIHRFYSAATLGIIAVPPGPSKKFVSNIKVGEYLCSGLPYLICEGVSEDDRYAQEHQVGVVVKDFSREEIQQAHPKLVNLITSNPVALRNRCRQVGLEYRGFQRLNQEFRKAFHTLISA